MAEGLDKTTGRCFLYAEVAPETEPDEPALAYLDRYPIIVVLFSCKFATISYFWLKCRLRLPVEVLVAKLTTLEG